MGFDYTSLVSIFPAWLAVFLVGMVPIAELRVAIPLGLASFHLGLPVAYFWAVVGNIVPIIPILLFLGPVQRFLSNNFQFWQKFFEKLFQRTRRKFEGPYAQYGSLALVIFVAIPLPFTGAWTGALAAWLFGIPFRYSVPLIALGVMMAGLIVSLSTLGVLNIFW